MREDQDLMCFFSFRRATSKMEDGLLSLKWNNHRSTFFHILSEVRGKVSVVWIQYLSVFPYIICIYTIVWVYYAVYQFKRASILDNFTYIEHKVWTLFTDRILSIFWHVSFKQNQTLLLFLTGFPSVSAYLHRCYISMWREVFPSAQTCDVNM